MKKADFDPASESIHGLLSESFQKREESEQDDQPMQNPYEQPSRRAGRSQQREEPVDQWEQQRSSSGSSEPPDDDEVQEDAPPPEQDDPIDEEVVDLWEAEDEEDYVVEQATRSSISASNPCVLYEAGIICEDGHTTKLMVLAIELYLRDAPHDFCHYTNFAYKKLFQLGRR